MIWAVGTKPSSAQRSGLSPADPVPGQLLCRLDGLSAYIFAAHNRLSDVQEVILHPSVRVRDVHIRRADQRVDRFVRQTVPVTVPQRADLGRDGTTIPTDARKIQLQDVRHVVAHRFELVGQPQLGLGLLGDRIRRLINAVTANRFLAVGIGIFITTLVQSSSVTSVMVIGLVNSELMALTGAIGVIIGANIGTTITGWILALKIGQYGLPLLGLAAFGWLFIKGEKLRYSALAVLGIGMVFFGLELMKDGFAPVRDLPEFASLFQLFEATDYLGVLKSALVGCVATLIIQ